MASKADKKRRLTVQTPSATWRHRRFLTPEEEVEFMDSLKYDDPQADLVDCTECDPEYND